MPDASRITAGELVLVCSRYDLGAIQLLRRFRGGSRDSPKVLVVSDRGRYLIKRRSPPSAPPSAPASARGGPGPSPEDFTARVALSHQVQLHLAARQFPVAQLIGSRAGNNSILELNGFIYEVFRFVDGQRYDRTPPAAAAAGRLLALLHRELRDLQPLRTPSAVTYHSQPAVAPTIRELIERSPPVLRDRRVIRDLEALGEAYAHAAVAAERAGLGGHPAQLIHADWHPGNLLYASTGVPGGEPTIVAVLDFDSVRRAPAVIDLANGALQFSILRGPAVTAAASGAGPGGALVHLDQDLFAAFCAGYRSQSAPDRLPDAHFAVVPWLMIEAVAVETLAPIAATGRFGKISARAALAMSRQAATWLAEHAEDLVSRMASR